MADAPETPSTDLDDFLGAKQQPKWKGWIKWIVLAVVLIAALFLLSRCVGASKQPDYATQEVRRGTLAVTVSATGKLQPKNQVDVGSQLSGQVIRVLADVNDRVTNGQIIAQIDPATFDDAITRSRAALSAADATVAQNRATVAEARAQLNRLQEVSRLSGGRVPSKTELAAQVAATQRAIANQKAAEANVVSARAQLSSDLTQRSRTVIRSPVSGVVLARQIEPGQTVASSFNTPTLFVIAEDLASMELEVAIDEADVGQVKQGQDATFTVDAYPGRTFPAQITRVDVGSNASATSSSSSTTAAASASTVVAYNATLSLANPDLVLRPGMTATADIAVQKRDNVLLVPNAALRFSPAAAERASKRAEGQNSIVKSITPQPRRGGRRGGGGGGGGGGAGGGQQTTIGRGSQQTIYVLGEDGALKPIQVITGATDGRRTEVTGKDLQPGMKVVTGQRAATSG